MGRKTGLAYEDYVKSGMWKCDKSPTGAHHWVELTEGELNNKGYFLCIHCYDVRKFPIRWDQVTTSWIADIYATPDAVDKALKELSNRRLG